MNSLTISQIKSIFITISTILFLFSCEYDDLNKNPLNKTIDDFSVQSLLPGIQVGLTDDHGSNLSIYNGFFTQYLAGTQLQFVSISQNDLSSINVNTTWIELYLKIASTKLIIKETEEVNMPHYKGVAMILQAYMFSILVDHWNDIPFNETFIQDIFTPKYDQGEQIYQEIYAMLDDAVTELEKPKSLIDESLEQNDLFFQGDPALWIKASNSLKIRLLLQSSTKNIDDIDKALDIINNQPIISQLNESLKLQFGTTLNESSPWYRLQNTNRNGQVKTSISFVDKLKNNNDPRLPFFIKKINGEYVGSPFGSEASETGTSDVGPFFEDVDATYYLISYTEVKFIEAELLFRKGDKDNAAIALNEAIRASLEMVTGKVNSTFINQHTYNNSLSLEDILEEKYVAMFLHYVSYNDWRRTDYPELSSVASRGSQVPYVYSWPYPSSEIQNNGNNLPETDAIRKMNSKVWWDVN